MLIWAACFLKEDEEGRIQRTLERWRDKAGAWPSVTNSRRVVILRFCAETASTLLDRVFGQQLLSTRAITVSATLSLGSLLLALPFIDNTFDTGLWGLLCCSAAMAPAVSQRLSWLPATVIAILAGVWTVTSFHRPSDLMEVATAALAVTIGVAFALIFIVVNRKILTWAAAEASFGAALVVLLSYFGATVAIITVPFLSASAIMGGYQTPASNSLGAGIGATIVNAIIQEVAIAFAAANGFTAIAAAVVLVVAAALAIDALFWFIAERPVYAAARYGIIQKKKSLFLVGVALLGSVSPRAAAVFLSAVERFAK